MSSMPPSAAFAINIDGMTISPSSWATDPQFQGQESFSGGTAFLNETGGNVVARGFGAFFSIVVMIVVYFDTMFSKNATITGEQFYTAGGMIKARLIASGIVSKWTWAATHLQSSNAAWNYSGSGPFRYAFGATIQILLLFGILAISLKAVAHSAHAICEIARARWGKTAHLPFLFFGFCSSIIITTMLLLGGAATVEILAGVNYALASFLIPWGIILHTTVSGLRVIYMASYLHTMMIIFAVVICMITSMYIKVYSSDMIYQYLNHQTVSYTEEQCTNIISKDGAGPNSFYRNADGKKMMDCGPVEGNIQRSYLSMISVGGLMFGIINIIGNFGTVFADQSYWQAAIAARPESAAEGNLLGGVCWFAVPFSLATSLGLASTTLMLPITSDESSSRLVPPAVSDYLMGDSGAVLILIVLFMTIVSTGSAENIAVSSLVAYDIYREYINPNATGKQVLFVSRLVIVVFNVVMGLLVIVLDLLGLNHGWVYQFMGIVIGSAVIPLWNMKTWKDASGKGAIISAWGGFALAVIGWLVGAVVQSGSITVANLGANDVMLSGNLIAIFSSGIIHFVYSKFVDPQNFDFDALDANIHLVEQDLSGLGAEQRDKAMIKKTKKWIITRGYLLTFVLIILWPAASVAARTIIESYFAFWVLLSVIWAFGAAITITVLPLWESQDEIVRVIVGIFSFCTGNLAAFEYADEKTPAKAVKEQAESDTKFFIPGSAYARGHRSLVEEFVPASLNTHRKTATAKLKMSALSLTLLTVPFISVVTAQIPSSPFGNSTTICPSGNTNFNYSVDGYPGSPFLLSLFQQNFSNPSILKPIYEACRPDHHCMISFEIDIVDVQARVFDEVITECRHHSPTWLLAYNATSPGPSIITPSGHETFVRFNNKISDRYFNKSHSPCINGRSGNPTSVHLHGSASLAPFDGWAEDETCRNETKDYVYPNNRPNTGWYHDHALHITADNAYYGLAGFYLTSSKANIGGCGEPWNLEGIEEKLLMLSDKVLDSKCQLYDDHEGAHKDDLYGDLNTVNGIAFPNMPLDPKWYRFRILNAAVSRVYLWEIRDENGTANIAHTMCKVIAGDGGYRTTPVDFPRDGLIVNVAERYEVVCDFRSVAGQTLYMWNDKDDNYMKKIPYFCYSHLIAKIVVGENPVEAPLFEENDQSIQASIPITKVLNEADIQQAMTMINNGQAHRQFAFGRSGGQWTINGETWDTMKIAADDVGLNTWELWEFKSGGGWHHPVHMHLVDFYILRRDDDTEVEGNMGGLKTYEHGTPKDVLGLGGGTVWTIARFGAHKGDYMFHCHNLKHEDNDMMRAYSVIHGGKNSQSAAKYNANPLNGILYSNFLYADPMLVDTAAKPSDQVPAHSFELVNSTLYGNLYRIFYPAEDDIQQYGNYYNPWEVTWCQLSIQAGDTPYSQTSKPTSSKPTTRKPTSKPKTRRPTSRPTRKPTSRPTRKPTSKPTSRPTRKPTSKPSTRKPTSKPSTRKPTSKPSTRKPTSKPSHKPTLKPAYDDQAQ